MVVSQTGYENELDLSSGTADASTITSGSTVQTNAAGTITIPSPSGSAQVSSGTTITNTGNGFTFSTVTEADVAGNHVEGGTNTFFGRNGELKADTIEEVTFQSAQATVSAQGVTSLDVRANGDFTIAAADYFRAGDIVFTNVENLQSQGATLSFTRSASATFGQSTSTNPRNFLANWQDTFTVESADVVVIGPAVFSDIGQSTFTVRNGQLQSATVTSAEDNNVVTMPNPIAHSSPFVQIRYDEDEKFRIELDKQDNNRKMLTIIPIDEVVVGFGDRGAAEHPFDDRITYAPLGDDASIELIEEEWPIYRLKAGQLNYTADTFTEILDAHCDVSEAAIHYDAGFLKVILSPTVEILCPGGRYSYLDRQKEKSYSVFNTGEETFELGLNKNNLLSDVLFLAGLHDDQSHGFVDFPVSIELWGIVQYDRFREFTSSIETRDVYESLNLPFQATYEGNAGNNHLRINLRAGNDAEFRLESPQLDPRIETYAISHSGMHRITERFFGEKVLRFFDYDKQPISPPSVIKYESDFLQEKPRISFDAKTLALICPTAQNVTLYAGNSPAGQKFGDDLSYLAGITFDTYVKKFGGGTATMGELT